MEREMEKRADFIKESLHRPELQSELEQRNSVLLVLDLSESIPPPPIELLPSSTANLIVDGFVHKPVVVPLLKFKYGRGVTNWVTPATIDIAGDTFGWIV
ncbi:hypothetical protein H0H93_008952 [Arthromyces matolae]|nr:hypothetical protein H0H93_008952 [Arthromyces matolae]